MNPFHALRNVLANLSEGAGADAVRPEASAGSSPAFQARLAAQRRTEAFVGTLAAQVPAELFGALEESVRHVDVAIDDLPALAAHLGRCRQGLAVALGRGGEPSADESRRLQDLARLERLVVELAAAADRSPPGR